MEDQGSGPHEGYKQNPLQRRHGMDANLRGDVVELEHPCEKQHGDGRHTQKRIDSDDDRDRETPGQLSGRYAAFDEAEQWAKNPAVDKGARLLGKSLHFCMRVRASRICRLGRADGFERGKPL